MLDAAGDAVQELLEINPLDDNAMGWRLAYTKDTVIPPSSSIPEVPLLRAARAISEDPDAAKVDLAERVHDAMRSCNSPAAGCSHLAQYTATKWKLFALRQAYS